MRPSALVAVVLGVVAMRRGIASEVFLWRKREKSRDPSYGENTTDDLLSAADASEESLHVPHLYYFVSTIPVVVRSSFDVTPASPLSTFEQEVALHPVFRVTKASPNL